MKSEGIFSQIIKLICGREWRREMKRENTISHHWSARIRWWTRYWHWSVGAASVSIIILVWWPPRIGIIRRNWWSIKYRRTIRWHSHVHWRRWWSWSTIWRIRSIRQRWLHWPQRRFLSDQSRRTKISTRTNKWQSKKRIKNRCNYHNSRCTT